MRLMRTGHAIIFFGGLMLAGLALLVFWPTRARQSLPAQVAITQPGRVENSALPASSAHSAATNAANPKTNLGKWAEKIPNRITAEQAEAYVRENHRNLVSLLSASRTSGEKGYLREAMERFPNDPRVAFDAYFFSGGPRDNSQPATPERRQWLENFKQSDPNNPLPNYLAARDDFRAGRTDLALQELQAASGKTAFNDYLLDSLQSTEEAYRSAGLSEADAKSAASWNLLLPHLTETKQLGENMADLAVQYQKSGDTASAQNILQLGLTLGQELEGPGEFPLINTLVGIAIQKKQLSVMDPASPYLDTGMTVQDQLDSLNQLRASLKSIAPQTESILPQLSDQDRVSFYDRMRLFGEPAAVKWAVQKYGTQ